MILRKVVEEVEIPAESLQKSLILIFFLQSLHSSWSLNTGNMSMGSFEFFLY